VLLIGFFSGSDVSVFDDGESVVVSIGDERRELSRERALALRAAIGEAVADRREYVRTVGVHREDGTYAVERRGADSPGNRTVFDCVRELRELYDRLPPTFDAEAVGEAGITGSRRHMVVRHFAEHPGFDCEIESRCPLRVRKRGDLRGDVSGDVPAD